jgi:ABC-type transporter Mla subunit MlaD
MLDRLRKPVVLLAFVVLMLAALAAYWAFRGPGKAQAEPRTPEADRYHQRLERTMREIDEDW